MTAFADLLGEETRPVWPAGLPSHLSATQLAMFQRCADQYRRRYILGEKERPGSAVVWGAADHYAHEQNFRQKIDSHTDISEDDVKVAFAEGFDQAVAKATDDIEWGDDNPADLKDSGVELVAAYHRQVSPLVQPVAVEERFTLKLERVPVEVIGYVDVRTDQVAIERKTARAKPQNGAPKPEWRIQGLLYQAVRGLPVEWHVSVKTKTPAVYTPVESSGLRLPWWEPQVRATTSLVENAARAIVAYMGMFGPDQPWPGAITHPWACNFCGFRPTCPWWGS